MTDAHVQHHIDLLRYLRQVLQTLAEEDVVTEELQRLIARYYEMIEHMYKSGHDRYHGQELVSQVFQCYHQIAHQVRRDLLWFFGGECLHFMTDDEISKYQWL